MRYYIYLDRDFLKNLFSVVDESNFNIEVVEYSLRKSITSNNGVSVEPCYEDASQLENYNKCDFNKTNTEYIKDEKFNKQRIGLAYDKSKICNIETQIKYINIEDISDIKNTNFYHKLCENIIKNKSFENSRIVVEKGYIKVCNNESKLFDKIKGEFFMLNDTFIWIEKEKLQGDLLMLSQMECEINVVGYLMNCKNKKNKILKAIAIFIE